MIWHVQIYPIYVNMHQIASAHGSRQFMALLTGRNCALTDVFCKFHTCGFKMDVCPPTICGGGAGTGGDGAAVTGAGAGAGVGFAGLLITVSSQVPTTGIREMYESA